MADHPIVLTDGQLKAAKAAKRTHICMPAWLPPGRRVSAVDAEAVAAASAGAMKMPTIWQTVGEGDRLWVQEETCELQHSTDPMRKRTFYRADLVGGRPAIPGHYKRGRWHVKNFEASRLDVRFSRYTLRVIDTRFFPTQEITWDEIRAEGGLMYGSDSRPQWWARNYGVIYPWVANLDLVGITFEFLAESLAGAVAHPHQALERRAMDYLDKRFPPKEPDPAS